MKRLPLSLLLLAFGLAATPASAQYYPTAPQSDGEETPGFNPNIFAPAPLRDDLQNPQPDDTQQAAPEDPGYPAPVDDMPPPPDTPTVDPAPVQPEPVQAAPTPVAPPIYQAPVMPTQPAPPDAEDDPNDIWGPDGPPPGIDPNPQPLPGPPPVNDTPGYQSDDPVNPVIQHRSDRGHSRPIFAGLSISPDRKPLIKQFTGYWLAEDLPDPVAIGLTQVMFPVQDGCGEQPQDITTADWMNSGDVISFIRKTGHGRRFSRAVDDLQKQLVQPRYPVLEFACVDQPVLFIKADSNLILAVQYLPDDASLWVSHLTRQ